MRATVFVVCLALVAAACGGDDEPEPTTTLPTTTTRPSTTTTIRPTTTTTTTVHVGPTSPLTGLPVEDEESLDRRALVVKIDNHPNARPQSGLPHADVVLELPVEGITRLVGVFHTQDVEAVGPIRSMRPSDWQVANLFGGPLVMSGGQNWVLAVNRDNGAELIGDVGRPVTFRSGSRSAPHNLYGDTEAMRELADARGYDDDPPNPIWEIGDMPVTAQPATDIRLVFSGSLVAGWEWNGREYERSTNGAEHAWIDRDGETSRITAEVLVVLQMRTYLAQPPPGGGAARAVDSIGEGAAWIFAGGRVTEGDWSRSAGDAPFELTTPDGDTMFVPAGRVWISYFPTGQTPEWS
ncbi:MAG TPA: DUF3048 domain-containing protein [Acidimicrobiia bacterium]|nr:DUF3048 domain-containing protein [Acidimicrobiia bacterium]